MTGKFLMQPTPDFNPSKSAKSLLRRSRQGALATLMTGSGDPYCSLVNVAANPDAAPILLFSRLAVAYEEHPSRCEGLADAG
jgi:putative heme iron utilization protein